MQRPISFVAVVIAASLLAVSVADAGVIGKPANQLGLIAYWSFNEGSGTVAGDSSGRKKDGTINNSPPWSAGKVGSALDFDGDNKDVGTTFNDSPTVTTISTWLYPRTTGEASAGSILSRPNQYTLAMCDADAISCPSAPNSLQFAYPYYEGNEGLWYTGANSITLNAWNHVVLVYDKGNIANTPIIYINGTRVNVATSSIPSAPTGIEGYFVTLGNNSNNFDGKMDEVRIYNRALSAAEISALYAGGGSSFGSSAVLGGGTLRNGLVGHWTFDAADFGTAIVDKSGQGNNGYVTGGSTSTMKRIGKVGQAIHFDGVNDAAEMGTSNTYNFTTGNFSVAFWIKAEEDFYDTSPIIFRMENGISGWAISTNVDKPELLTSGNGGSASNANTSLTRGLWQHVVVVRSGGTTFYYLDGAADGSDAVVSPASNAGDDLTFGTDDFASYIKENLDDVRIYNRALTAIEVRQLYNLGTQKINSNSNALSAGGLNSGLVGHWTFDGADITANAILDKSGSGNNAGFHGGSTSSAKTLGKMGQALKFNGSSSYVDMGTNASIRVSFPFTIATWIKVPSFGSYHTLVTTGSDPSPIVLTGGNLQLNTAGQPVCGFSDGLTAYNQANSTTALSQNTWQHITCVVRGAGDISIYIDGAPVGLSADSTGATSVGYQAGGARMGDTSLGNSYFGGSLDDVRIYNRAFSASEAQQLYNLGR